MLTKRIACSILVILIVALSSCSKGVSGTYTYEVMKNVTYEVNTKKLKYHSDIKSIFLYFELTIENKSNKEIYLNIGEIKAKLNGELNSDTYYDSLASVMPKKEKLNKGETRLKLYFVFPENPNNEKLNKFEITNYGLS